MIVMVATWQFPCNHRFCYWYMKLFIYLCFEIGFGSLIKLIVINYLVQHSVSRLVASQRLLAEVLVRFREALHLSEACVQRHGGVVRVLSQVQVRSAAELFLDH